MRWPVMTADLATGRVRNRSMTPSPMSAATLIVVVTAAKAAATTRIPGMTKLM